VVRVTIGRSMTARAIPPASMEKRPMVTTTQAQTKIPTTMLGIPFITSAVKRTTWRGGAPALGQEDPGAHRDGDPDGPGEEHEEDGAQEGVGHPAPFSPTGAGSWVKKSRLIAPAPADRR
jgi:hypothetical protein